MRLLHAIIFLTLYASATPNPLSPVYEIFQIIGKITKIIEFGINYNKDDELLKQMESTSMHIDKLSMQLDSLNLQTITTVLKNLPNDIRLEIKTNDLLDYITRVDLTYDKMGYYLKNVSGIEPLTLKNFAKSVLWQINVQELIGRINTFLVPIDIGIGDSSILTVLQNKMEENGNIMCELKSSPQQVIMNLYNAISITELKGYATIQYSYMLLKMLNKGNFTNEVLLMRDVYKNSTHQTLEAVSDALNTTSRIFWRCDPKKYIKDENYLEVTEFLQGYIENEVDMNPTGTCEASCPDYRNTKNYGCFDDLYCSKQRECKGRILNCGDVDSTMYVCPNNSTNRRYDYIKFGNGKVLGNQHSCSTSKVDGWIRGFYACSYCMCLCDDPGINSDRYFNLRKASSEVENNMIITGLRFAKNNRIIHIQIQQGQLMPNGIVDADTVSWVPVDDYKLTDTFVADGQDYHMLKYEERGLDFDNLNGTKDELLTGIRFLLIDGHLNLEIELTKFDFKTGMLFPKNTTWKSNFETRRKKFSLENKDVSTKTLSPSMPDSIYGDYTEFTHTSYDADVGQTTIPFLDSQAVASNPPVPLSGVGLYHKGFSRFGGFVALSVTSFEFGTYLKEVVNAI